MWTIERLKKHVPPSISLYCRRHPPCAGPSALLKHFLCSDLIAADPTPLPKGSLSERKEVIKSADKLKSKVFRNLISGSGRIGTNDAFAREKKSIVGLDDWYTSTCCDQTLVFFSWTPSASLDRNMMQAPISWVSTSPACERSQCQKCCNRNYGISYREIGGWNLNLSNEPCRPCRWQRFHRVLDLSWVQTTVNAVLVRLEAAPIRRQEFDWWEKIVCLIRHKRSRSTVDITIENISTKNSGISDLKMVDRNFASSGAPEPCLAGCCSLVSWGQRHPAFNLQGAPASETLKIAPSVNCHHHGEKYSLWSGPVTKFRSNGWSVRGKNRRKRQYCCNFSKNITIQMFGI